MSIVKLITKYKRFIGISLINKFIGLLKDSIIANFYGAGLERDIYLLLLNFSENFYGYLRDSIQAIFLPNYSKSEQKKYYVVSFFIFLSLFLLLIIIAYMTVGWGLFGKLYSENIRVSYIKKEYYLISLVSLFTVLIVFLTQVMNANEHYSKNEFRNFIGGVSFLLILVFMVSYIGTEVMSLVLSLAISTLIIFLWQIKDTRGFFPKVKEVNIINIFNNKSNIDTLKDLMYYCVFFILIHTTYSLYEMYLASTIGIGAISWKDYAYKLYITLATLITGLIATPLFTKMSLDIAKQIDLKGYMTEIWIKTIVLIFPIISLIYSTSILWIKLIYYRGEFTMSDLLIVSQIFGLYCFSIPFYILVFIVHSFFMAGKEKKKYFILNFVQISISFITLYLTKDYLKIYAFPVTNILTLMVMFLLGSIYFFKKRMLMLSFKQIILIAFVILASIFLGIGMGKFLGGIVY